MKELINVKKVMNASGRMTKLGVSTPKASVLEAMSYGAAHYVVMDELMSKAGQKIAELIQAPAVCITNSASSGIALTVASLICRDDIRCIETLHQVKHQRANEVLILKGHNVNYGAPIQTMIELGGGVVKEVGYANMASSDDIIAAINDQTIAIMYVQSHHTVQKNMVSLADMIAIAKLHNLPVIVDAAAEETLSAYIEAGADYVIYSGTKAIEGPTSGFIATSSPIREHYLRLQYLGIGRAMKIGKEGIYGLVQAVQNYYQEHQLMQITYDELVLAVTDINKIVGLKASLIADEAGRKIYRIKVDVNESVYGRSATQLSELLIEGDVAIYVRDYYKNQGYLCIDPRPLTTSDLAVIQQTLAQHSKMEEK